jgi:hypothetical protein
VSAAALPQIEAWPLSRLRPHPENAIIFGDPEEAAEYESIKADIGKRGITDALMVKADGTILSGHLRAHVAEALGIATIRVVVVEPFGCYRDELEFIVKQNTERRHFTKAQIAQAFHRLRTTPREQGGTAGKKGGGEKGKRGAPVQNHSSASGQMARRSDDDAAATLGIGKHAARALETVFVTQNVPAELKQAVNAGKVSPTRAAKAVKAEVAKQGGAIKDSAPLVEVAQPKPAPAPTHESRVADEAARFQRDFRELADAYKAADRVLTRRPLKSVIGPTEHHEYLGLIRDLSLRAWREVESVQGPTNTGRQMALVAIEGGKR